MGGLDSGVRAPVKELMATRRMLRALFVAVLPEVGLLPVQGLVENDQCASARLTTSLAVVADSWAYNYPTAPHHGQVDGVLSHAMPEPNVETKLDNLCARIFRDEVNVTLVDIGANKGQTVTRLLHAWRDARTAPHIVAFEPGARRVCGPAPTWRGMADDGHAR